MNYVKNIDGNPIFATHLVEVSLQNDKINHLPFQIEKEGIVSYSKQETSKIIKILKELEVDYNIISLVSATKRLEYDQNFKYSNRTEILEHFNEGKAPKGLREEQLEKRIDTLEKQVKALMNKVNLKH